MKRGVLLFVLLGIASAVLLIFQYSYLAQGGMWKARISTSMSYQLMAINNVEQNQKSSLERDERVQRSEAKSQESTHVQSTQDALTRNLTRGASTSTSPPPSTPSNPSSTTTLTTSLNKIPPSISSFFPTNFMNITQLIAPPNTKNFTVKNFPNFTLETQQDVFEILSRWDKLDLPFYPNLYRLRIKTDNVPKLRRCNPRNTMGKFRWREFVECSQKVHTSTPDEVEGNHILFTLRTCAKFHKKRLPLLFHTWLENVNRSNVVIVTDDVDPVLQYRATEAGLKYRISVPGYERLCEKAGDEISLMFLPENLHYQWFCHVDDDMYVNLDRLVDVLANFKRDEPVYFGRGGSYPGKERRVMQRATLGEPGSRYHFAVGGMYCLSRSLLEKARRWIGGREAFGRMCKITKEPEDVTVGFVVGILLGLKLWNTELIKSHGLDLSGSDATMLKYQVAISYGFGAEHWMKRPNNAVRVPKSLFNLQQDPSQFLSLHCHHHPTIGWCLHKKKMKEEPRLNKRPPNNLSKSDNNSRRRIPQLTRRR